MTMPGSRVMDAAQPAFELGSELQTIPGYRVKGLLGQGGMATVYLAEQVNLGRDVALKVMTPQFAATPGFAERFLAEGRVTARLNHPNIVTVHDVGQHGGLYFLAAELLPGGTLKERLPSLTNLVDKLRVLRGIARGLGYAHKHKIVHRDVKPVNIMFRDEAQPVVTDFGIAKSLDASHVFTQVGGVIGTPHYMSPEQAQAMALDGRSDLYALGIMMYEVLVGKVPFDAPEPLSILYMHVQQPPPQLPDEFAALQPILDRLLAKLPEQRFKDTAQFCAALEPFLGKLKTGRVTVVATAPKFVTQPMLDAKPSAQPAFNSPADGALAAELPGAQAGIVKAKFSATPEPLKHSRSVILNLLAGSLSARADGTVAFKSLGKKIAISALALAALLVVIWRTQTPPSVNDRPSAAQVEMQKPAITSGESGPLAQSIRAELISAVRSHMAKGRLIEPADDCALALVSRILEQAPTDTVALGLLKDIGAGLSAQVRERWAGGKRADALSLLRTGLDKLPNDLELNRTRADLQLELDQSASAATSTPAVTPDSVTELLKRAETLFGQSQWTAPDGDNAVELLNRVLAIQPGHPKAVDLLNQIALGYEKVALTWRDRGRPDQALAQVRNGLKAQPTNSRLLRLEQQLR